MSVQINPNNVPLDQVLPAGLTMSQAIDHVRTYASEVHALAQWMTPEAIEQVTHWADQWACLPSEALARISTETAQQAA